MLPTLDGLLSRGRRLRCACVLRACSAAAQGELMAVFGSTEGIGRILGPLVSTYALHVGGRKWLFTVLFAAMVPLLLAFPLVYRKLTLDPRR